MEISCRGSRISIKLVRVNFLTFRQTPLNYFAWDDKFFDELPYNENRKVIILSLTINDVVVIVFLIILNFWTFAFDINFWLIKPIRNDSL